MTETSAERAASIERVLDAARDTPPEVQAAAVQAVTAPIPAPQSTDVGWLWKALVVGLLILIGIALIGVLWAMLDGDAKTEGDKALIVFTPLLTGLLGLFVSPPTQQTT